MLFNVYKPLEKRLAVIRYADQVIVFGEIISVVDSLRIELLKDFKVKDLLRTVRFFVFNWNPPPYALLISIM